MTKPGESSDHSHADNAEVYGVTYRCSECGRIVDEVPLKNWLDDNEEEIKEIRESLEEDLRIFKQTVEENAGTSEDGQSSG